MNYRHAFHAGNFADLVKHALLTACLARLGAVASPLDVIDTHAGAGLYDLSGEAAAKSGEAAQGIVRLLADAGAPAQFDRLKAVIGRINPGGGARLYPGSPFLIAQGLRPNDRLTACELRPDDFALLGEALKGARAPNALAVRKDGYLVAAQPSAPGGKSAQQRRLMVLIDPPYERPDDEAQVLRTMRAVLARDRGATVMVWLPFKDLESFDRILRDIERARLAGVLVAEARLRRPRDPMRMNGCALVLLNPPAGMEAGLKAAVDWIVATAGGPGGLGKLWRLEA